MKTIAIIGLGNPNIKYDGTRHNIGAYIIKKIIRDKNISHFTKSDIDCWEYICNDTRIFFVESWEYMNSSGLVAAEVMNKFGIFSEDIIIIQDDMDFDLGLVRLKFAGGPGGHNGIKSIINIIGDRFYRIRFGIGRSSIPTIDYVLSDFGRDEVDSVKFKEAIKKAIEIIDTFINNGPDKAFNIANRRQSNEIKQV
jgi:PTH1 family peptidyl-tRNA hydrolase